MWTCKGSVKPNGDIGYTCLYVSCSWSRFFDRLMWCYRCFWRGGVTNDTNTGSKSIPPWKLPVWFSKIDDHLQKVIENLKSLASEDEQTDPFLLPRLAENWENLTEESGSFRGVDLLPGWLVTNIEEEENSESSRKKKSKKYTWIARFLVI